MRWLHDLLLACDDPHVTDVRTYPVPGGGVQDLAVLSSDGTVFYLCVVFCTAPGDDLRREEVIITRHNHTAAP
jgi:hypothetical protein